MSECCYFCDEEGDFVKAVASYYADDRIEYFVCPKHLQLIKLQNRVYEIVDPEFEDETN